MAGSNTLKEQKLLLLAALAFATAVVIFHAFAKPEPEGREVSNLATYMQDSARWEGKFPPDFTLALRDGGSFQLADHIGREVILLNFFATWCGPCKAEMPELQAFLRKHSGDPVVMVGINVDEKPALVDAFIRELNLVFPIGIDTNQVISAQYGIRSYPTTVLIGVDGKVRLFTIGEIANADVVIEPLVREQLAQLARLKGITRAAYEAGLKDQVLPPSNHSVSRHPTEVKKEPEIILAPATKAFADRMKCPSCDGALFSCSCNLCEAVKKKLATVTVTNRTDEAILRELFLEKGGTP